MFKVKQFVSGSWVVVGKAQTADIAAQILVALLANWAGNSNDFMIEHDGED